MYIDMQRNAVESFGSSSWVMIKWQHARAVREPLIPRVNKNPATISFGRGLLINFTLATGGHRLVINILIVWIANHLPDQWIYKLWTRVWMLSIGSSFHLFFEGQPKKLVPAIQRETNPLPMKALFRDSYLRTHKAPWLMTSTIETFHITTWDG